MAEIPVFWKIMGYLWKYFIILFCATFRRKPQTHFTFFSPLSPSLFPFVQSNSFVMRQFLFPYICACVHSGKKRPHSLAACCSLLAHTLTIPCERPQGDCPAVHSHIHCALGGNRLAWQPNISLFSMILWDSCEMEEKDLPQTIPEVTAGLLMKLQKYFRRLISLWLPVWCFWTG